MKKRLMRAVFLIGALFPIVSIHAAQSGIMARAMRSVTPELVSIARDLSHNEHLLRDRGLCCDKNMPSIEKCVCELLQDNIKQLSQKKADHISYWTNVGMVAIPSVLTLGSILWKAYQSNQKVAQPGQDVVVIKGQAEVAEQNIDQAEQRAKQSKISVSGLLGSVMAGTGLAGIGYTAKKYIANQQVKYTALKRYTNHLYRRAVVAEYGQRDVIETLQKVETELFQIKQQLTDVTDIGMIELTTLMQEVLRLESLIEQLQVDITGKEEEIADKNKQLKLAQTKHELYQTQIQLLQKQSENMVQDLKDQMALVESRHQEQLQQAYNHQNVLRDTIASLQVIVNIREQDVDLLKQNYTNLCQKAAQDGRDRSEQQETMQQQIDALEEQLRLMNQKIDAYHEALAQVYVENMRLEKEQEALQKYQVETVPVLSQTDGEKPFIVSDAISQTDVIDGIDIALQTNKMFLKNNEVQTDTAQTPEMIESGLQTEIVDVADFDIQTDETSLLEDQLVIIESDGSDANSTQPAAMIDQDIQCDTTTNTLSVGCGNDPKTQDFAVQVGKDDGVSTRTTATQTMPWITETSSSLQQARSGYLPKWPR